METHAHPPASARIHEGGTPHADRRRTLALRLEDGYRRIDEAQAAGADIAAWEAFWLDLLGEYIALCDELALAA